MKKRGILSFIIYSIMFVGLGVWTLIARMELESSKNNTEGFESLGLGLGFVLLLILTIIAAVPFIVKLIHVISGWGFFGFLAGVVGIALIGILGYSIISEGGTFNIVDNLPVLGIMAAIGVATVNDFASLKR